MFILTKPIKGINIGDTPLVPLPRLYNLGEDLIAPYEPRWGIKSGIFEIFKVHLKIK